MTQSLTSLNRLNRLRALNDEVGRSVFLVRDTSDIFWLTAFDGVFDEEQAHALYVDNEHAVLHTDSRYAQACERAARENGDVVLVDTERDTHAQFVRRMWRGDNQDECGLSTDGACETVDKAGVLGIDDGIALAEYRSLKEVFSNDNAPRRASDDVDAKDGCDCKRKLDISEQMFAVTHNVVLGLRAVKDAGEVARLRAAQAIADAAFSFILDFMRPGVTEREVQLALDDFMRRHGADALAFPSIVATGENGASPHAVVSDKCLQAGECVVLDFGAKRAGYCSDMTRTVFLGAPTGDMLRAWEAIRQANETVEHMLKPGVTGAQAHEMAEAVLNAAGFGGRMGHGLGHGVGIDIHELPNLSLKNELPLVEGNVVTVEPGIYIPGEFGMRLEDFGIVTDSGFEVFTQSTHEMVVL